tara:strand:- start:236 stop:484 length:249 start_codon:yes stop_codon:yes gene_type:complete
MITIKIWFLLVMISTPNATTVKYMGSVYPAEKDCLEAKTGYLNVYEAKPQDYKDKLVTEAYCLSFDSFPIKGMNYKESSLGV